MVASIGAVGVDTPRASGGSVEVARVGTRAVEAAPGSNFRTAKPSKRLKRWDDPEWRRRFAVYICLKLDVPYNELWTDPRYIQAKRAEFDPDVAAVWIWWCALHWSQRRFFILHYGMHSLRLEANKDEMPVDVKSAARDLTFADVVEVTRK